jgi:hypothetical protein
MDPEDGEDRPPLRVVSDDEVAPTSRRSWRRTAVALLAVAVVAGAVIVGVVVGRGGSDPKSTRADGPPTTGPAGSATSTEDLSALPTIAPVSTVTVVPQTTTTSAPSGGGAGGTPTLTPLPVDGSTGGVALPVAGPPTTAAPTTGSVRVRIFNGFTPGQSLEVWDVSSTPPVRYGSIPYGGFALVDAHGALLNNGVSLQLSFVIPGQSPTAAKSSASSGPWPWDLAPTAGSAQTLVLVDNAGLAIRRIDDHRAEGAVHGGSVHVVPIAHQLVLAGSRTLRWGHQPSGCLGPITTDKSEFDVPVGTGLELFAGSDTACGTPLSGPVTLTRSTAVAVIGLDAGNNTADLVALPLD